MSIAFTVKSKDLFDRKKNPTLSLSAKVIEKNPKIPKNYLGAADRRVSIKQRRERLGQIQYYINKHEKAIEDLRAEKQRVKTEIVNLATFKG